MRKFKVMYDYLGSLYKRELILSDNFLNHQNWESFLATELSEVVDKIYKEVREDYECCNDDFYDMLDKIFIDGIVDCDDDGFRLHQDMSGNELIDFLRIEKQKMVKEKSDDLEFINAIKELDRLNNRPCSQLF